MIKAQYAAVTVASPEGASQDANSAQQRMTSERRNRERRTREPQVSESLAAAESGVVSPEQSFLRQED